MVNNASTKWKKLVIKWKEREHNEEDEQAMGNK